MSDLVKVFEQSGLHLPYFQHVSRAYAVAVYRHSDGSTVCHRETNNLGTHAERQMIQHLGDVLENEELGSQTVKLFVNFSPCYDCSSDVMQFLERADDYYGVDIQLEIVFAHLYRIRRPTCLDGTHGRVHKLPDVMSHTRNLKGLKKLKDFGIILRPFAEEDWKHLWMTLRNPGHPPNNPHRLEEDQILKRDLLALGL